MAISAGSIPSAFIRRAFSILGEMLRTIRSRAYSVEMPEHVLFDLESTLFATFGKQEGGAFNFHYQANGYHPLLCFDGMTGDLLKIELRPGTQYCCNGAAEFMRPLLEEYQKKYPNIALFLRGDSGFATVQGVRRQRNILRD